MHFYLNVCWLEVPALYCGIATFLGALNPLTVYLKNNMKPPEVTCKGTCVLKYASTTKEVVKNSTRYL